MGCAPCQVFALSFRNGAPTPLPPWEREVGLWKDQAVCRTWQFSESPPLKTTTPNPRVRETQVKDCLRGWVGCRTFQMCLVISMLLCCAQSCPTNTYWKPLNLFICLIQFIFCPHHHQLLTLNKWHDLTIIPCRMPKILGGPICHVLGVLTEVDLELKNSIYRLSTWTECSLEIPVNFNWNNNNSELQLKDTEDTECLWGVLSPKTREKKDTRGIWIPQHL